MAKKQVLFITPSLCYGGIEQFLISMLETLDSERYEATLFMYINDTALLPRVPGHVKVIMDEDRTHYHRSFRAVSLHLKKKVCSLLKIKNSYAEVLQDYIRTEKMKHPAKDVFRGQIFDTVVANAVGKPAEMALHIPAKKRFVFFHSSLDLHHELNEKTFPEFDGIVAVSPGVQDMLRKTYPAVKDKVLLLENYVRAEAILEKAEEQDSRFVFDKQLTNLCSCGRLSSEKGFDMAGESARILNEKGYRFRWYFVGDGPEREKIEDMIRRYSLEDRICITGYTDNPFTLMKSCDIYIQPSYEESYGRTIREAMILGLPVVSTATVGGHTLIRNGVSGILTEINAEALADGIAKLLDNRELQAEFGAHYTIAQNEA